MNAVLADRADAVLAQPAGRPVISPSVSVCRMDVDSGLCSGCLRTLAEIPEWSSRDDDARRVVWSRIAQRAVESQPAATDETSRSDAP